MCVRALAPFISSSTLVLLLEYFFFYSSNSLRLFFIVCCLWYCLVLHHVAVFSSSSSPPAVGIVQPCMKYDLIFIRIRKGNTNMPGKCIRRDRRKWWTTTQYGFCELWVEPFMLIERRVFWTLSTEVASCHLPRSSNVYAFTLKHVRNAIRIWTCSFVWFYVYWSRIVAQSLH